MRILLIETSTERGVIAYADQDEILFARELPFGSAQSTFLIPFLAEALHSFGFPPPLDLIGVGIGPGSYTGIRLGVSVAQALAYAWKVPLAGVCSLDGFNSSFPRVRYAALLDARIGGVYLQTGWNGEGSARGKGSPQLAPIEEVGRHLEGISHLVTPFAKALQAKLSLHYPDFHWLWEERAPSIDSLLESVKQSRLARPPDHLNLLYLRRTEAEGPGQEV